MNIILFLFIFFSITILIAWKGNYRTSIWLFILFLFLSSAFFIHDITDKINIQF